MPHNSLTPDELRHELANVEQQKKALQNMLGRATDEIEDLVASDCDPATKEHASEAAKRFRRAAEL